MRIRKIGLLSLLAVSTLLSGMNSSAMAGSKGHCSKHKCHQKHSRNDAASVLEKSGKCKTELAWMKKAGTYDMLHSKGPITVFCPTDEAYGKLAKIKKDEMSGDPKKLAELTKYHVLPRKLASADIQGASSVCTKQGECLMTNVRDGKAEVDGCLIIEGDIPCDNGIIHFIDEVPIPERGK